MERSDEMRSKRNSCLGFENKNERPIETPWRSRMTIIIIIIVEVWCWYCNNGNSRENGRQWRYNERRSYASVNLTCQCICCADFSFSFFIVRSTNEKLSATKNKTVLFCVAQHGMYGSLNYPSLVSSHPEESQISSLSSFEIVIVTDGGHHIFIFFFVQ